MDGENTVLFYDQVNFTVGNTTIHISQVTLLQQYHDFMHILCYE